MKTNLYFYLNDKAETKITAIYDCPTTPIFKKGYKFWFSISKMYPRTIGELNKTFNENFVNSIIEDNKNQIKLFDNTEFKIISVYSELEYDTNISGDGDKHRLKIEYKCKKIKHIYWSHIPFKIKKLLLLK